LLTTLTVGTSFAAEFTLRQLLAEAALKHPSVLQARNQAQSAGFDVEGAQWGRFPSLSSEVRTDTGYAQSSAKLEQPLWTGGKVTSRIALSESNLKAAQAGILEAESTALTQVSTAFFEALRLEQRLISADLNVKEHERLVALIERRAQAEISPNADATLAQARLQQAVGERIGLKKQLDASLTTLTQWTVPLTAPLKAPSALNFERPTRDWLVVERALAQSAQRKRLRAQIESAQAQVELSKAQLFPSVVAGYQLIWAGVLPSGSTQSQAYIGLQFQPGAGLSARSGIQAALSRKDAIAQELEAFDRNLSSQVTAALTEFDAMGAQLGPADALLAGTTEVVESYLRQYQLGRKNWLDVLNAQREKTQALYNYSDMQFGYQLSKARLMILTGDVSAQQLSAIQD
jgi:adhesin transport system outer membrane protein